MREFARDPNRRITLRRAYTQPSDGALIATESHRRLFPAGLRKAVIVRDRTCRMPWCDAPIRQIDHVHEHADGGPTSMDNAAGLCQACNLNKQALGLTTHTNPDGSITLTTPTGHTYTSHPPPLPGTRPKTTGPDSARQLPEAS